MWLRPRKRKSSLVSQCWLGTFLCLWEVAAHIRTVMIGTCFSVQLHHLGWMGILCKHLFSVQNPLHPTYLMLTATRCVLHNSSTVIHCVVFRFLVCMCRKVMQYIADRLMDGSDIRLWLTIHCGVCVCFFYCIIPHFSLLICSYMYICWHYLSAIDIQFCMSIYFLYHASLPRHKISGVPKGFAFIEFSCEDEAQAAVEVC